MCIVTGSVLLSGAFVYNSIRAEQSADRLVFEAMEYEYLRKPKFVTSSMYFDYVQSLEELVFADLFFGISPVDKIPLLREEYGWNAF